MDGLGTGLALHTCRFGSGTPDGCRWRDVNMLQQLIVVVCTQYAVGTLREKMGFNYIRDVTRTCKQTKTASPSWQ